MAEVDVPVALPGQEDDPLGIIRCSGSLSLSEARQMVDDEVDDIPDSFVFVIKGVPLTVRAYSVTPGH